MLTAIPAGGDAGGLEVDWTVPSMTIELIPLAKNGIVTKDAKIMKNSRLCGSVLKPGAILARILNFGSDLISAKCFLPTSLPFCMDSASSGSFDGIISLVYAL